MSKRRNRDKGQALILVLIFMLIGAIIITALFGYMGTGLKTGKIFQNKTDELYTADAGIDDGIWQVSYGNIKNFTDPVLYDLYDYSHSWNDPVSEDINAKTPAVTISNVWIPKNIATPNRDQAFTIINDGKLMVTDSNVNATTGQIKITYTKGASDQTLKITTLGMWLPPGFTYTPGSSNLWNTAHTQRLYTSENVTAYKSGQCVTWSFSTYPFTGDTTHGPFPGVDKTKTPMTATITYQFTTQETGARPNTISWITTAGVSDIPYSWDADVRIFHINSIAGGTTVDTYLAKNELRQLGAAINGDYRAVGNSLLVMGPGKNPDNDPHGIRYQLLDSSEAAVTDIPSDANIAAAYLYWSGWLSKSSERLGSGYGTSVNFKINGYQVCLDGSGNPQRGSQPVTSSKNQTYANDATSHGDYSYSCYKDVTDLVQWELKQEYPTVLNYPGNAIYHVGPANGIGLGDTDNEWSYAGWSLVIIYTSPATQGHQLYLYDKFTYAPNDSDIDPTGNTDGPGGTISGFLVPAQVAGDVDVAKMTVFVGEGDWCYAGDFIAFNAPSQYWSHPSTIPDGNPSKLWDGITLGTDDLAASPYVPNNAARPDNLWNSNSQTGLNDGGDIKTFNISWASGLLHQGDTSARIDLPTRTDSWNLVYIILSFRSAIKTGGNLSYVIR